MKKILFVYTIVTFLFLVACSQEEYNNSSSIIFNSESGQWKATIQNDEIMRDGKRYFNIIYQYKGDLKDLDEVQRITFAQGTEFGTQVINVYDPSYKEKLMAVGNYQEEYEDQYGIIIDHIQKRESKDFIIEYGLMEAEKGYTTLSSIKKNGILIIIKWQTQGEEYEDHLK
ncbi:hypothetical protein [Paenibacillus sp. YAF4_2]|uniref:hypothetical protein n=1 Tax=Paenibacillus sp. YAF4_2 TaxID=3233085 RepID=UPI003F99B36D